MHIRFKTLTTLHLQTMNSEIKFAPFHAFEVEGTDVILRVVCVMTEP